MIRTNRHRSVRAALTTAVALSLSALIPMVAMTVLPAAEARADGVQQLNDAVVQYEQSRFDDAIRLANDALKSGELNAADATRAREIIARAQVKAGRREEARESFKDILRTDPGYRADPVRMPPDELEVFNQALAEFQADLIQQGKRIPASISAHFGYGKSSNSDMSEVVQAGGGEEFGGDKEFGGAVRFPIRSRWSLDIELSRFRESETDSFPPPGNAEFVVSALPLTVSAYYTLISGPKRRLYAFAGAGPMLVSEARINVPFFTIQISISDSKTGYIAHGGVEGEWLLAQRIGLYGRALGRVAKATGIDFGEVDLYGAGDTGKRDVDFSGFAVHAGVRAYIGY